MKDKLAKLLDLKSIVTIMISLVFCYLSIIGKVEAKDFMMIVVMVFTFYFNRKQNS